MRVLGVMTHDACDWGQLVLVLILICIFVLILVVLRLFHVQFDFVALQKSTKFRFGLGLQPSTLIASLAELRIWKANMVSHLCGIMLDPLG